MRETNTFAVEHCSLCGGDGIDHMIKDEDGRVARGERRAPCGRCYGTGHIVRFGSYEMQKGKV